MVKAQSYICSSDMLLTLSDVLFIMFNTKLRVVSIPPDQGLVLNIIRL